MTPDNAIVRMLVQALGFFWVFCPVCPRRALCNPTERPGRCVFCQVPMVDERPPAVVN